MEPSPSLPVSSGPALAAGARSSPRGMVTKKRGWSVVSKMEIQMYEYVEVAGSDSNLSSTQLSASPSVSRVSEKLRQLGAGSPTTHHLQCSVFCGGRGCKYENAGKWDGSAFTELYSHWVTDNVLAMARPSTTLFREHNLLTKLKGAGIMSVVNLQLPGEHPHCGPGLEGNTGFTYNPEELMRHEIFFYNYGWPDYGVPSLPSMLDTVKVMDFACETGKVAVHCHAGLGRTGALIACYLVYSKRVSAEDAITTVRDKRPGSLQTRGQVGLVKQFSDYLHSLWQCYPGPTNPLTIQECLDRQSLVLHGDRKNSLKSLPLVVHALCSRLKELFEEKGFTFYCLSQSPPPLSPSRTAIRRVLDITTAEEEDNECWVVVSCVNDEEETERTRLPQQPCCAEVEEHFFLSLLSISECSKSNWARRTLAQLEAEFNTCWEWTTLKHTSDLTVLSASLYSFLRLLKEPLLSAADLSNMSISNSLFSIPKVKQQTLLLVLDTLKLVMPSSLIDSRDHVTSLANHIALLVTQTASSDTLQLLVQLISEYLLKNITNEA